MMVIGYDGEIKSRIVIDRYMSDEPEKKTRAEEAVEMAEMLDAGKEAVASAVGVSTAEVMDMFGVGKSEPSVDAPAEAVEAASEPEAAAPEVVE